MDFLYFPEDKSEYIPGFISVLVIIILSGLIIWLLIRASKKEVEHLEEQGYAASYDRDVNDPIDNSKKMDEDEDADEQEDNVDEKKS